MKNNIITIITPNSTLTDTMIVNCGKYSVIVKDIHGDVVVTKHPNRTTRRGSNSRERARPTASA